MPRSKGKASAALIDHMLGEASWLLSHAQALTDYGRKDEASAEWERAAQCEEQVACLLDSDGQELEAAIHRVSAASCYEKRGQYTRAVTLLRAGLGGPLHHEYRGRVEQLLVRCLAQAQKELKRTARLGSHRRSTAVS
jgi:hypothetical protein